MLDLGGKSFDGRKQYHHKVDGMHSFLFNSKRDQINFNSLQSLPFEKVQHKVTTLDVQPLSRAGNIIVYVTGLLIVGDPGYERKIGF